MSRANAGPALVLIVGACSLWRGCAAEARAPDSAVSSPLDKLDSSRIPAERLPTGLPKECVAVLGEHRDFRDDGHHRLFGVAFSPNGKFLAVTGAFALWDVDAAAPTLWHALKGKFRAYDVLAFAPDGKTLAASGESTVLWDLTGPKPRERSTLKHASASNSVSFSPDGKTLATAHHDAQVRLWDLTGPEPKEKAALPGHTNYLEEIAFSPDGHWLASGGRDKTVRLWDLAAALPTLRATLAEHQDNILALAFAPDSRLLASSGSEPVVRLWDLAAPEPKQRILQGHGKWPDFVRSTVFLARGRTLASLGSDGRLIFRETASGQKLGEWQLPKGSAEKTARWAYHGMAAAPDGRHLAVITENTMVFIFRLTDPALILANR